MDLKTPFKLIKRGIDPTTFQWRIINRFFFATAISGLTGMILLLLSYGPPSSGEAPLKGMKIGYWAVILMGGFLIPLALSIFYGLSLSFGIRKELTNINEAHNALSRGNNQVRLSLPNYSEFVETAAQFNQMAERTQKQVESLQRLVNENAQLVQNAEAIGSSHERKKIARELHDAISQQLFAISITLTAVKTIVLKDPQKVQGHLVQMETMIHQAQQELRALIMHLRPVSLNGTSFTEGLTQLLEELKDKHRQIEILWEIQKTPSLSPGVEDHLFRVVQEAISNVLRHSQAKRLYIRLIVKNKLLLLFIEDNGIGFSTSRQKKSSYGITTMEERISEIGGRMDIYSVPSQGTRIEIRVPIEKSEV